ncbi:MAG TPA: YoaK family protein [Terriglobales bacterium]
MLLSFVAGYVDIVGALTVYGVFTAHMTGITVHLGQQLIQHNWKAAIIGSTVLAAFVFGSIIGRVIIEIGSRSAIQHIGSFTLTLELILLASVIPFGGGVLSPGPSHTAPLVLICLLLATLATAMGLQTATLTRVGALTVHTTFVTGMLNKLAQLISHYIFHTFDLWRAATTPREMELLRQRGDTLREARFIFSIWLLYLAGAACGTWLGLRWRLESLYVPCCILLLGIAVEIAQPLTLEEKQDESER